MSKKPFVRIQSNATIKVTAGLHSVDVTNASAHVPDRLKVNPMWPKLTILIKQGVGIYPSEITEWNTVKRLVKDNVLTVGEYLDSADTEVSSMKTSLNNDLRTVDNKVKSLNIEKKSSLAELAGE